MNNAPSAVPTEPTACAAPPVKGVVEPLEALLPTEAVPEGAEALGVTELPPVVVGNGGVVVGGTVTAGVVIEDDLALLVAEFVAFSDVVEASLDVVEVSSDVVEAETGAAVAAHEHTSAAAD